MRRLEIASAYTAPPPSHASPPHHRGNARAAHASTAAAAAPWSPSVGVYGEIAAVGDCGAGARLRHHLLHTAAREWASDPRVPFSVKVSRDDVAHYNLVS